jgi:hypothetical protein
MSKKFFDALDNVLDRPIAFQPSFKKITGSTNAALLLSQAFYWTKRTTNPDGWFWKTREDWMDETGLTEAELDTAREKCRSVGVIEEKLKGVPATLHYRVIKSKVYELLGFQFPQIPGSNQSGLPEGSEIPDKQESGTNGDFNKESESTSTTTPPVGLSEKEKAQANAKVDAMIANTKKVTYRNREKLPEPYLMFGDLYFELTKQEPTKSDLMDWMGTFEEWKQKGLRPEHIRAAFAHAARDGGFPVGRPGSLTNTAVGMKTKMLTNAAPAINDSAVETTKQTVEEKFSGEFTPRPDHVPAPVLIKQKLQEAAQQRRIRK